MKLCACQHGGPLRHALPSLCPRRLSARQSAALVPSPTPQLPSAAGCRAGAQLAADAGKRGVGGGAGGGCAARRQVGASRPGHAGCRGLHGQGSNGGAGQGGSWAAAAGRAAWQEGGPVGGSVRQIAAGGLLPVGAGSTVPSHCLPSRGPSRAAPLLHRWRGEAPEPRPGLKSGRIPGSKSLPFADLLQDGRCVGAGNAAPWAGPALLLLQLAAHAEAVQRRPLACWLQGCQPLPASLAGCQTQTPCLEPCPTAL